MEPFAKSVVPILIEDEMRNSYMDYSMSVIIGRALPDVRDGLKPVHRRILYAMHEMGLRHNKRYSKCAGVVGEVLKKFHPHGDSAVYDALVRMAQPWNLRYPMVDGQGNFGSVDGDSAAAYRYTESRMTALAEELLVDIDKETVDFEANFDGQTLEPTVLPSRFPSLLVNGADGIAVGMATKIPPHNLGEVTDACVALIDDPEISIDELMQHVPGPDFPTAGTIYGRRGVRDAYHTGRGRVVVRGEARFEELDSGTTAIVIDELPFQVNKSRLLRNIAELAKSKRIDGIRALRDESDRDGMRVVVELKRDAFPDVVLNHLFKHTSLQSTFGVILLAIVNRRPRVLTLKQMLSHFISHRREVILRRTRFELRKAKERAHILEGFLKALDLIDEIIKLIRASQSVPEAREGLIRRFGFTEIQAQAILDMRLQRLTGMERQKIEDEYGELSLRIEELEAILGSEERLMGVVKEELLEVREQFADARRTRIVDARSELTMHDLVAEEDQVVTLSHAGYIKRCKLDAWRTQRRGGHGKRGMSTRAEDFVSSIFIANTHSMLLVFTDQGKVYPLHVYDLPETNRDARGKPIVQLVPVDQDARISAVVSVRSLEPPEPDAEAEEDAEAETEDGEKWLLFVSRAGLVKRTRLSAFKNLRSGGMRAAAVAEGDELLLVRVVDGDAHVMLFSRDGKCIRFTLDDVPEYGRTARGNLGINLADGDLVVDAVLAPPDQVPATDDDSDDDAEVAEDGELLDAPPTTLLTVTSEGYGTRTPFTSYKVQNRNGKGLTAFNLGDDDRGWVVGAVEVEDDDQLMLVTNSGRVIRIRAAGVPATAGRIVKGVRLMRLGDDEDLVDIARLADPEDEDVAPEETPEGAEASGSTDAEDTEGADASEAEGTEDADADEAVPAEPGDEA